MPPRARSSRRSGGAGCVVQAVAVGSNNSICSNSNMKVCLKARDGKKSLIKLTFRALIRSLLMRFPIYSGVMRIVNSNPLKSLTSESEVAIAKLRTGQRVVVDVSDYCGRPIYYWGDYDARITQICVDALGPGDYMLDIGANYGEIALAAAAKVGKSGGVHAFEPNPRICKYLRRSVALNGFSNLFVHEVALGVTDGRTELIVPPENTGAGSLLSTGSDCTSEAYTFHTVQVRAAGQYLNSLCIPSLAVVKLDVEGMEGVILESMKSVLIKYKPRLICFESHEVHVPFFDRVAVRTLAEIGFKFQQVVIEKRFSRRVRLAPVEDGKRLRFGYDFVATLDGSA